MLNWYPLKSAPLVELTRYAGGGHEKVGIKLKHFLPKPNQRLQSKKFVSCSVDIK
jgi:hypothetical protein